MDFKVWIFIVLQNREGGIACSSANLQDDTRRRRGFGNLAEDWELLLQPFAVFEEVGRVVLVEVVPPFYGVGVETV